jgi:hypothetical protein
MTDPTFKTRELRARRKAQHQGLELRRSRTRDPDAPEHGRYQLWRTSTRGLSAPTTRHWLTLDEIEQELTRS